MAGSLSPSPVVLLAPPPTTSSGADEEEFYSSWSLFLVCALLILSLFTSYYLQIKRIRAIHETLVAIFAGMIVGAVLRLAPGHSIREMLANFFRNFGTILTFAFLGTFISAVGVGVLVYIYSFLGLESLEVTLIECLIFGSTLSATDPVTILAIFNQYKVDPKLYTVIFGESLLNDAVSIVMYETLTRFHGSEIHIGSIFHGIGIFLLSFSVSMALGVVFGLAMSLILKHSSLNHYPQIETCLVALSAYTCYFFSNGIHMSGIVSLLFCGITLKHYAYHTMSRRTQRATKYIFATLAQLSENFIFVYLGLSLFTSPPESTKVTNYFKPVLVTITTVAVVFTRYAAVFPLSEAINFFHRHARGQRTEELPHSYQMMLFWAGLRGAVGVALAAGFQGENAQTLKITVLVVVVLTVVVFGGTTARMLEVLGIRTGVEDEGDVESDEEDYYLPPIGGGGNGVGGAWYANVNAARRRLNGGNGNGGGGGGGGGAPRWGYGYEDDARAQRSAAAGRIGMHYETRSYNHHEQNVMGQSVFSAASSDSYDSDGGEVLPMAIAPSGDHHRGIDGDGANGGGNGGRGSRNGSRRASRDVGSLMNSGEGGSPGTTTAQEDGKWFQALDERYLIPLFSNATASRTFHARKARRASGLSGLGIGGSGGGGGGNGGGGGSGNGSRSGSRFGTPADSDDELDEGAEMDLTGVARRISPPREGQGPGQDIIIPPATDERRAERGLASPMLRRDSEGVTRTSPPR